MQNITYLLGAGASAHAIPTIDKMKSGIEHISKSLANYVPPDNINEDAFKSLPQLLQENIDSIKAIAEDLKWLIEESKYHQTVDTLAKKYYLNNDTPSLKRLKKALICYFTIQQVCRIPINPLHASTSKHNLVDGRYDSFIAAIAKKISSGITLRENIKILTWNYDLQFELALKRYVPQNINAIKENFQIFPNHNSIDVPAGELYDPARFAMIKLNGNAFWDNPANPGEALKTTLFDEFYIKGDTKDILGEIAYQYSWLHKNKELLINRAIQYCNFAWEADASFSDKHVGYANNIREAGKVAENTNVLVVIGYSFPVFNRETDKALIDKMEYVTKVYIQDPNAAKIQSIMVNAFEIFQGGGGLGTPDRLFQLETSTDQFVIPFELA